MQAVGCLLQAASTEAAVSRQAQGALCWQGCSAACIRLYRNICLAASAARAGSMQKRLYRCMRSGAVLRNVRKCKCHSFETAGMDVLAHVVAGAAHVLTAWVSTQKVFEMYCSLTPAQFNLKYTTTCMQSQHHLAGSTAEHMCCGKLAALPPPCHLWAGECGAGMRQSSQHGTAQHSSQ